MEEVKNHRLALAGYIGLLTAVILVSSLAAWLFEWLSPSWVTVIGTIPARILVAAFTFVVGHLLLEWWANRKSRMGQLWPFRQVRRFRRWLWAIVFLGFMLGVFGNLFSNLVQKNLDQEHQPNASPAPIPVPGSDVKPK